MQLKLRKYNDYAVCSLEVNNHTIDLGMLSRDEVLDLKIGLDMALDDIQWFLNVTEKNENNLNRA